MAVREGGPDLLIIPIQNSSKIKLVSKDLAVISGVFSMGATGAMAPVILS